VEESEKEMLNQVQHDNLLEVYPNPSFGNMVIKYGLSEKTDITLKLYDISGRLVKTIYSGTQEKGEHEVELSGQHHGQGEHMGSPLPTGIYFIRLEVPTGRDFASSTGEFMPEAYLPQVEKATKKLTILR